MTIRQLVAAAALACTAATPALGQRAGDGFLFHEPQARFSVRGGYDHANAGSDLFDFVMQNLTVNRSDFSGLTLGAEVAFPLTSQLELSLDGGYSRASKASEFRHFVDNNDKPIEQRTTFERVPLSANVRLYLTPPGRAVGRLAWIPNKVTPWIGAGGGMMYYRFRQYGDFVDFANNNVFYSNFDSHEWTGMLQALGGVDVSLSPTLAIRGDARYLWAKGDFGRDFGGFDRIDLSGVQGTLGLSFRM